MTDIRKPDPRAVLREPRSGKWLDFTSPCRILTTRRIDEVLPLMRQVDKAVEREGLYAVGFISYEAAPAFDACLPSKGEGECPLLMVRPVPAGQRDGETP